MIRLSLASVALLLAGTALAQTAPPTNTTMQNGQPRAVTPVAVIDTNGKMLGTSDNPLVTSASGGGSTTSSVSRADYIANTSGTGFSTGDRLERVVNTSPTTGAITGAYWVNVTTGLLLGTAPSAGSINPMPVTATQSGSPWGFTLSSGPGTASGNPIYDSIVNFPATQTVNGTVTVNVGTTGGLALDTTVNSLFKSGQTIGNTGFTINGTLPAYAATPTFNLGTAPVLTSNVQGSVTASTPSYTNGSQAALSLTTTGNLRVDASNTTQPVNNIQVGGAAIATGTGASNTGTQRVAVSSDSVFSVNNLAAATTAAPAYTNGSQAALSLNLAGGLRVDNSGVTQPVSNAGTFATQVTNTPAVTCAACATQATLASISNQLPASLGAKTGATSLSVVPSVDTQFPVIIQNGTSLQSGFGGSVTGTPANNGAVFFGHWDLGNAAAVPWTAVNVTVLSPTSGTLVGYYSLDGTTDFAYGPASTAVSANVPATYSMPIMARYGIFIFTNTSGGTGGSPTRMTVTFSGGK